MSVHFSCDYCGAPIESDDTSVTLSVNGTAPDPDHPNRYITTRSIAATLGHYHTTDERPCWWKIRAAIQVTESIGPTLETMETLTGQAVAVRRRKHNHEQDGDR